MKYIELTRGYKTIVDDEDFEWLSQWKWHYLSCGYVARRDYNEAASKYFGEFARLNKI